VILPAVAEAASELKRRILSRLERVLREASRQRRIETGRSRASACVMLRTNGECRALLPASESALVSQVSSLSTGSFAPSPPHRCRVSRCSLRPAGAPMAVRLPRYTSAARTSSGASSTCFHSGVAIFGILPGYLDGAVAIGTLSSGVRVLTTACFVEPNLRALGAGESELP